MAVYQSPPHNFTLPRAHVTNRFLQELEDPSRYLDDFQAELPLYEQSGALVDFLLQYRHAVEDEASAPASPRSQASRIEALSVTMYEHGIVEGDDVVLTQVSLDRSLIVVLVCA